MGEGFQFLDILFFAMVAAFLVLRLRSVLGRRTGHERRPEDAMSDRRAGGAAKDKVVALPDQKRGKERAGADEADAAAATPDSPLAAGLTQIRIADPGFDPERFLTGASAAFEMIVAAFAAGDRNALRPLLAPEVMDNFDEAIAGRETSGERLETTLVGIKSAEIVEARMAGRNAVVTVKIVSEQVNVTHGADGAVVGGDANYVATITDLWTFSRDTKSRDPNWLLVETASPN